MMNSLTLAAQGVYACGCSANYFAANDAVTITYCPMHAAAPAMYEALRKLEETCPFSYSYTSAWGKAWKEARATLKLATGGSILEIEKIKDIAQDNLDDIYHEHFPSSDAPKLSNGIVRIVLEAAFEAGIVEMSKEIDMGQVEANDLDWNDPGIIRGE